MKRNFFFTLLVLVVLSSVGCVVKDHIDFAYIPIPDPAIANDSYFSVAVVVSDQRPEILLGEKEPYYIGIFKNTFGVPHDARTIQEISFAENLQRDIELDLRASGIKIKGHD